MYSCYYSHGTWDAPLGHLDAEFDAFRFEWVREAAPMFVSVWLHFINYYTSKRIIQLMLLIVWCWCDIILYPYHAFHYDVGILLRLCLFSCSFFMGVLLCTLKVHWDVVICDAEVYLYIWIKEALVYDLNYICLFVSFDFALLNVLQYICRKDFGIKKQVILIFLSRRSCLFLFACLCFAQWLWTRPSWWCGGGLFFSLATNS